MSRLCYLTRNYRVLDSAGNKAKTDNEDTLKDMGAVNLGIQRTTHKNKVVAFFFDLMGVVHYCFAVKKGDRILLQYPVKKYFAFLCKVAHMKGAKVMTVIHDLGAFRRKKLTTAQENKRLSNADYVIASNEVMRQWLLDHGMLRPVGALGLFDYRSDVVRKIATKESDANTATDGYSITYAGSLAMRKNAFFLQFKDLVPKYRIHIYGNHKGLPGIEAMECFKFHGFTASDDFIQHAEGDFGLVWDGDSVDDCVGNFGEYLRYNSPHKVSFYLRAGLPIIVWRQAAVAEIVEREGIGLCIDSLKELDAVLAGMTEERMQSMRANVVRVSEALRSGGYLRDAIGKALKVLD